MDPLDGYRNMTNISSDKVALKIGSISIFNLFVLILVPFGMIEICTAFKMNLIVEGFMTLWAFVLAVFCIVKTKNNPVQANIKVVLFSLLMDQRVYKPLDSQEEYNAKMKKIK